jgi:hypothetical protein
MLRMFEFAIAFRLLVALLGVQNLLLCAKHLFVAAIGGSSRLIQARRARQATGSGTFFQQCRARLGCGDFRPGSRSCLGAVIIRGGCWLLVVSWREIFSMEMERSRPGGDFFEGGGRAALSPIEGDIRGLVEGDVAGRHSALLVSLLERACGRLRAVLNLRRILKPRNCRTSRERHPVQQNRLPFR